MASSSISKSVIWQVTGKFFLQGIAFFTAPIFTRILSSTDYGYTALYSSWVSIFTLLIGLQVHGSINNARKNLDKRELNEYLSCIMTVPFILFILLLIIFLIFKEKLSSLIGLREDIVILIVINSFFSFVISFYTMKLDSFKQVEKSTVLSVVQSIVIVGLSLVLVLNVDEKEKYICKIYAQTIPTIMMGTILLVLIYCKGKKIWNTKYILKCLSFSLPMVIHTLGHLIFNQSDRIMLQKILNESTVGIYSITFTLCGILSVIVDAVNVSWIPFYYDYKRNNKEDEILQHTRRYLKFMTLIMTGFLLLAYDVFKLLAPIEYWEGMKIIPLFVLSNFFSYLYLFPVNFEFFYAKTKIIPILTFFVAIINIIINFLTISKFGIIGAAIGTLVAHMILFLLHELMAAKILREEYEYSIRIFLPWIITIIGFCVVVPFIQKLHYVRWFIFVLITFYLLIDIKKHKSLF